MDTTGRFYLGFAVILLLGMLTLLWFMSKKSPKGVLLFFSFALWATGQGISSIMLRETKLVGGVLSLTGTIGIVWGVIDFFRKRGKERLPEKIQAESKAEPRCDA